MIVTDAREDQRFKNNPLVTGDPNIVFYAGIPLVNKGGFGLGTLCVIDTKPKTLTSTQITALRMLSENVIQLLETRKAKFDLELLKMELELKNNDLEQFSMVVSHDIRSPLANILLITELLNIHVDGNAEISKLVKAARNSAQKINELVNGILSYYITDKNVDTAENIDMPAFFESLKETAISPKKLL